MRQLFLRLSLEWSMDDDMKDFKKSPIYQFWLLITRICPLLAPWGPWALNFNGYRNWVEVDQRFPWPFHSLYNGKP
jgi:polyferredoxin